MNNKVSTTKTEGTVNSEQRLEIAFDAEALATIDEIANNTHRDREEVISDALGLYSWANNQVNDGLDIGSIRNGKALKIISLPSQKSKDKKTLDKIFQFFSSKLGLQGG